MSNIFMGEKERKKLENKVQENEFFKTNGFQYEKKAVEESRFFGDTHLFIFHNEDVKRTLEIRFTPNTRSNISFFSVYISNDQKSILSVSGYLENKKIISNPDYFQLQTYAGSFEQQVDQFLKFLNEMLEKHMYDILMGKRWEQIPFDWHGYK